MGFFSADQISRNQQLKSPSQKFHNVVLTLKVHQLKVPPGKCAPEAQMRGIQQKERRRRGDKREGGRERRGRGGEGGGGKARACGCHDDSS
jgi:hypothetical protein